MISSFRSARFPRKRTASLVVLIGIAATLAFAASGMRNYEGAATTAVDRKVQELSDEQRAGGVGGRGVGPDLDPELVALLQQHELIAPTGAGAAASRRASGLPVPPKAATSTPAHVNFLWWGDPTWSGWLITAVYASAAILCGTVARRDGAGTWMFLAAAMVLLGINKQLDLHHQFTGVVRNLARAQGWYDDRRDLQQIFILGLAVATSVVLLWVIRLHWHARWPMQLGLVGLVLLAAFILLRAVSFHHVDSLLRAQWIGANRHVWLEMVGVIAITIAASYELQEKIRLNLGTTKTVRAE